ncbi:AraC family transcriptional regulator [Massilibacteroides sp.]|uniref:helix-turn-helix transcriptional regulator n=1 Tax=Massilibacteroides sp. TaxID=2034766 RepID=UPI00260DE739|nr:AraC family transcriptional regulator [Massilibacteroides sp.]MDD4516844.1 AraC family transcriptional regulator [Massilibacteroides sp.]
MLITIVDGHDTCPYNSNEEKNIERLELAEKKECILKTNFKKIVMVCQGVIDVSLNGYNPQEIGHHKMFYLERGQHLKITSISDSELLIFRFNKVQLCNCFSLDKLFVSPEESSIKNKKDKGLYTLPIARLIYLGFSLLKDCLEQGLSCKYFYRLKTEELLFIIGKIYSMTQLRDFFREGLSTDISFSDQVRENIFKYHTIQELAQAMNYTVSGFEKRFKKVFKTTPHKWLKDKKADKIYYDLTMTDLTMTEITDKYNFNTNNYLITFCKSYFGMTPGKIRKNRGV